MTVSEVDLLLWIVTVFSTTKSFTTDFCAVLLVVPLVSLIACNNIYEIVNSAGAACS